MRRRSLSLILLALAVVLVVLTVYQVRRHHRVLMPRVQAPRVVPPLINVAAPARVNVVVAADEGVAGDSVRAILERDFDQGSWLRVLPIDSTPIAILVRASLTSKGVRIVLVDGTTGRSARAGDFSLPSIATVDSTAMSDSLTRDLAAKDAVTRSLLAHNATLTDSLLRAQALAGPRRQSSFWLPAPLRRAERAAASRDSLIRVLAHANADIRARARRDTLQYETVRNRFGRQAGVQRDSLMTQWRWAVHGVADQVTLWIAGHRGIAQSRIAYVAGGELRIIDADGANDHIVAQGGTILSPTWRHDGAEIAFSHLNDNGTQIAQLDLSTGTTAFLSAAPRGLNITPVYSPDDQWIVFARGGDHGTDLVAVPRAGGRLHRIVSGGYDNAGPVFDPDGNRIAFSSARPQTPQIYSVRIDGSDERIETPITHRGRSYRSSPDWSPDGRAIAFEQQNGNFQLWLMTLPDRTFRRLTSVGENEDPSWGPDARHIVFSSTRNGVRNLWVLDVPSNRFRQLTTHGDARLASWSPAGPRILAGSRSSRSSLQQASTFLYR